MKALVYHGPDDKSWDEVPDPVLIDPTDAIVQVDTTTICGTDLHILKGDVPAVTPGRILGHEGVGTVLEVGSAVRNHSVGDRVIISCISSCGTCCTAGAGTPRTAWRTRARPGSAGSSATSSTAPRRRWCASRSPTTRSTGCPSTCQDEAAVLLSDIFPTGFEIGVQYGRVKPGDTVAVVGAGPVGLAVDRHCGPLRRRPDRGDRPRREPARPGEAGRRHPLRQLRRRRTGRSRCSRSPTGTAWTSRWRPSACPRRSRCAPSWCAQVAASRTSGSTASRCSWTCRTCGSRTSPSAWVW